VILKKNKKIKKHFILVYPQNFGGIEKHEEKIIDLV